MTDVINPGALKTGIMPVRGGPGLIAKIRYISFDIKILNSPYLLRLLFLIFFQKVFLEKSFYGRPQLFFWLRAG